MPFGKYRDEKLVNIPADYLVYCLNNMTLQPTLEKAIRKILDDRKR